MLIGRTYQSPLGEILLLADESGISGLWFRDQKHFPMELSYREGTCPYLDQGKAWLEGYFAGEIPGNFPPLAPSGTAFQRRVWAALLEIPYGTTVTYGTLAKKLGIRSSQAVGGAVGRNPISLMIPCHRVVGAGGQLTGYAGGLHRKEWLLTLEGVHSGTRCP